MPQSELYEDDHHDDLRSDSHSGDYPVTVGDQTDIQNDGGDTHHDTVQRGGNADGKYRSRRFFSQIKAGYGYGQAGTFACQQDNIICGGYRITDDRSPCRTGNPVAEP